MFISKDEKASMKAVLVETNKSMQELKRRMHQLEETMTLLRRIDAPLATPVEPEPVVSSEPVDYHELFKTSRKSKTRTPGLTHYVKPFLVNMQTNLPIEIPVPSHFDVKSLRSAIGSQMNAMYGFRSYYTDINDDQTSISVERLL